MRQARRLVLTDFLQRYSELARRMAAEAGAVFDGVIVAEGL